MKQLANAADTSVAQVIDVVGVANAVSYAVEVVDGGEDIVDGDDVRNKLVSLLAKHILELLLTLSGVEDLAEQLEADVLADAALSLGVKVDVL